MQLHIVTNCNGVKEEKANCRFLVSMSLPILSLAEHNEMIHLISNTAFVFPLYQNI